MSPVCMSPCLTVVIWQEILKISTCTDFTTLQILRCQLSQGNDVMVTAETSAIVSCDENGLWCWKGLVLEVCMEHKCPCMSFVCLLPCYRVPKSPPYHCLWTPLQPCSLGVCLSACTRAKQRDNRLCRILAQLLWAARKSAPAGVVF